MQSSLIPNTWANQMRVKITSHPAFRLGPVYRGQFGEVLSFLWPTVHTTFSNAPTFRGQSRLSDFGCALDHSATRFRACAHLMKTAVRYQLRAQGRSPLPGPNMFGGTTGRNPSERPHYGIAGGSPGKRDPMWTRGISDCVLCQPGSMYGTAKKKRPGYLYPFHAEPGFRSASEAL